MSDVFYDAFISYSTQDSDFVTALRLALEANGRRVWQDVKELELTAEWWAQIRQGIAAADNFLFVVSSRSMASPICHLELEHARELQKRVIVIRYEAADKTDSTRMMIDRILTQNYLRLLTTGRDMFGVAEANWASIEAEQNITIATKDDLLTAVPRLVEAFDKDLLYIRQANILLGRAREWSESGNNASFLLVGEALKAAEAWRTAGKSPAPTADHIAYIEASRAAEDERLRQLGELESRREAAERATEQVQRKLRQEQIAGGITAGFGGLVIGLAVMATVFALQLLGGVQGQVREANSQLSAIPPTVTALNMLAVTAKAASDRASTQVADANYALSTATQALATGTQVAQAAGEQQITLDALSTEVLVAEAAVTQAEAVLDIAAGLGNAVLQNRDYPPAQIATMDAIVVLYPDHPYSYLSRGLLFEQQGNYERAIADFDRAIELNPQYSEAYYTKGNTHSHSRDFEQAVASYTQAILLDPSNAAFYHNRGTAYAELGESQAAIDDFERAIDLNPQYAAAYNNRGAVYATLGDTERAIADYDQAIALEPQYFMAYYKRGLAYGHSGNAPLAIADLDMAITLNPLYPSLYLDRGYNHYFMGNYDQAIADFREFERLGGELDQAEQNIIQAMERTLERQRARQTPTVTATP